MGIEVDDREDDVAAILGALAVGEHQLVVGPVEAQRAIVLQRRVRSADCGKLGAGQVAPVLLTRTW